MGKFLDQKSVEKSINLQSQLIASLVKDLSMQSISKLENRNDNVDKRKRKKEENGQKLTNYNFICLFPKSWVKEVSVGCRSTE